MPGASRLTLAISIGIFNNLCSFHQWHSLSYSSKYRFFKEKFGQMTPAAKGLLKQFNLLVVTSLVSLVLN